MFVLRLICVLQLLVLAPIQAITMAKIASYAHGLITKSAVPGQVTRVCSCSEQSQCIDEMEQQAHDCASTCISYFSQVTSTPNLLLPCYMHLVPQINGFSDCMQSTIKSCVASSNGPQSPYTSIDRLLGLLEAEAIEKKADIMSQQMVSKIKPVAEAAFSFAGCVKQCFMKKNSRGYCFDRMSAPYHSREPLDLIEEMLQGTELEKGGWCSLWMCPGCWSCGTSRSVPSSEDDGISNTRSRFVYLCTINMDFILENGFVMGI